VLSICCYIVAGILFLLAATNQTLFSQPPPDEIAWGLFFVVLAWLLAGIWRPAPWRRDG